MLQLTLFEIEVLSALKRADPAGLSDAEVARAVKKNGRGVRETTQNLANKGCIREGDKERRSDAIRPVRIWHITDAGLGALDRSEAA